ncbi:hypothetical protein [Candidatus Wolbachia massiliensis]|uniref:Uncharacterized protein n=1 Tax=Candidatus Wolbachia massiliensis TaxID=1845000 RepID=A0A7L7YRD3_9RICK|nr:hypothetical protein [Candidatus Wolbachia massiliensis]QOD38227.1 hypothetical protein ID128_05575 [Candidatus Wolbachia massiliensis]
MLDSTEAVFLIADQNIDNNPASNNSTLNIQNIPKLTPGGEPLTGTSKIRKYEYIDCNTEEQMKLIFSDNPPGSSENKNNGKYLQGKVVDEVKHEIANFIGDKDLNVELRIRRASETALTARIMLSDSKKEIKISDLLAKSSLESALSNHITAFTIQIPNKNEFGQNEPKRGIRGQIDKEGARVYEVINGSYQMTLKWYVEGKECNIKINIHDNGQVDLIEGNGVTEEQLRAHKEVKVGKPHEAKFLHEALASQLQQTQQESSEAINPLPGLEGVSSTPHQASALGKK